MKIFMCALVSLLLAPAAATLAATPAAGSPTGTWKVFGDVQGVPVILTCSLVEAASKLTGACLDDQQVSHAVTGEVKDQTIRWAFQTTYEGSPITVNLSGTLDVTGAVMNGTIAVDPMEVDGQFSARLQPASAPAVPAATPSGSPSL